MPLIRRPELQNSLNSAVSTLKKSCSAKDKANLDKVLAKVNEPAFEKQAMKQLNSSDPYLLMAAKILAIFHDAINASPIEKLTAAEGLRKLLFLCNDNAPGAGPKQEGPRMAR